MLPLFSFYFFCFLSSSSFDNWVEIGDELPCFTLFSLLLLSFIILFSSSSYVWAGLPCCLSIFLSLSFLSSCLSLLSFLILSLTQQKLSFCLLSPSLSFFFPSPFLHSSPYLPPLFLFLPTIFLLFLSVFVSITATTIGHSLSLSFFFF